MAELVDGKRLIELRVIDLKTELERRGLDKSGNKASLLERLSKAIASEGFDPDEYLIKPSIVTKAAKKASVSDPVTNNTEDSSEMGAKRDVGEESMQDSNSMPENNQNLEQDNVEMESDPLKEDSNSNLNEVEQCPQTDEQPQQIEEQLQQAEEECQQADEPLQHADEQSQQIDEQPQQIDEQLQQTDEQPQQADEQIQPEADAQLESQCATEVSSTEAIENSQEEEPQENMQVESQEDQVGEVQKKTRVAELMSEDTSTNDSKAEHNGIDNEDSINLTIGEDEAILLAEEVDSNDKSKDAGEKKKQEVSSSSDNKKADSKGSSGRAESSSTVNKKEETSSSQGLAGTKDASAGHKSTTEHGSDGSKSGDPPSRSQKKEDKDKKSQSSTNASSRNLWVSGLSSTTRATDLKQIFSKYGKVIGAKVVTNARTPGARCYGYVTMFTSDDAARCIQHLHRTELHGRVISVEKAKGDSNQSSRKREATSKSDSKDDKKTSESDEKSKDAKNDDKEKADENAKDGEKSAAKADEKSRESSQEKKDGSLKDSDNRSTKSNSRKPESGKRDDKSNSKRSWDRAHPSSRSRSRERQRKENVLSFAKIKEERERNRAKERERMAREEKRRRQEEMQRAREIERRHREEAARLEREREKLRMEREKIEQEKAELLRLERERQKLEREKIDRERMEIKRQQLRVEDSSRRAPPPPPSSLKRGPDPRRDQRDTYEPDRKRLASGPVRRHSTDTERRGAARIPDRAERYEPSRPTKEFSRGGGGGGRPADHYPDSRNQRNHNAAIHSSNARGIKESRGFDRPPPSYSREVPRGAPASKNSRDERYNASKPVGSNRDTRYPDNGRNTGWHSGPPPSKTYHSASTNRNEQSNWGRSDNTRWANTNNISSNNVRHPGPQSYHQTSQMQPVGITNANSRSYNAYDPYKQIQNVRKY